MAYQLCKLFAHELVAMQEIMTPERDPIPAWKLRQKAKETQYTALIINALRCMRELSERDPKNRTAQREYYRFKKVLGEVATSGNTYVLNALRVVYTRPASEPTTKYMRAPEPVR